MLNKTSSVCTICRRAGEKLFLKGERCYSPKCAFTRRSYGPGVAGVRGSRGRKSDYALRLIEKQKAKGIYDVQERQFRNYYQKAKSFDDTGSALLTLLEQRLDNVIKKANFAKSIQAARQFVVHEHVLVNGKKVKSPSYNTKIGDKITLDEKLAKQDLTQSENLPRWLKVDYKNKNIEIIALPERSDINQDINEQLIVEYYAR